MPKITLYFILTNGRQQECSRYRCCPSLYLHISFFQSLIISHPLCLSLSFAANKKYSKVLVNFAKTEFDHLKSTVFFPFPESSEFGRLRFWKDSVDMY